jgi:arsenate reductase
VHLICNQGVGGSSPSAGTIRAIDWNNNTHSKAQQRCEHSNTGSMKKSKATAACTIYHNPRCTKSRATLALLNKQNIIPIIIEYLEMPPTATELKLIVKKLGMKPGDIVRIGEPEYQTHIANKQLNDAQLIAVMVDNPVLIERPIVVMGERAAIGRPPENILQLLT